MSPDGLVVDASALVAAVTQTSDAAARLRHQLVASVVHAPHLVDAEAGNVLRRLVLRGELGAEAALTVLHAGAGLIDHRYPHRGAVAEIAWSLRANLSFYDACYVAVAARLGVVLLTADRRLAGAPSLPCSVDVVD